jgi:hypothetical protein
MSEMVERLHKRLRIMWTEEFPGLASQRAKYEAARP